jgi:uncharacterized protein YegL
MAECLLPVYLVIDESEPIEPTGWVDVMNNSFPEFHAIIASDPLVSDTIRLGLVAFSESAEELMALSNLADVVALPGLQARRGRKLAPVFELLEELIARDLERFEQNNKAGRSAVFVARPYVVLIVSGEPDDRDAWRPSFDQLLDKRNRFRPEFVALGLNDSCEEFVRQVGTIGAFLLTPGLTLHDAFDALLEIFRGHSWGYVSANGSPSISVVAGPDNSDDGVGIAVPVVGSAKTEIGSAESTNQGGHVTTEYATGENILPFYIVCDESGSMGPNGGIDAINAALPELHSTIASDPLVSDKCRIGLITFSDSAEELMSLTNLADVVAMPGMQPRGLTNYGSVFDLLKSVISRDIANLKGQGYKVYRPAVFFITDGEPTDVATWESSYRSLVDKNTNRHAPNIIAFGVDGADASTIGKVGTLGGFVSTNGVSPADSLREIIGSLTNTIFDSASSSTPQLVVPAAPAGTTAVPLEEV